MPLNLSLRPAATPETAAAAPPFAPSFPPDFTYRAAEPGAAELAELYPARYRLLYAHVLVRHGERTPYKPSPVVAADWAALLPDPAAAAAETAHIALRLPEEPPYGGDAGRLTAQGRATLRAYGAALRRVYVERLGLLGAEWDADRCALRATNYCRTQNSLKALLCGLYPQPPRAAAGAAEPVAMAITVRDEAEETLFATLKNCPDLGALTSEADRALAPQLALDAPFILHQVKDYLATLSEADQQAVRQRLHYLEALPCALAHGLPVPPELERAAEQLRRPSPLTEAAFRLFWGRMLHRPLRAATIRSNIAELLACCDARLADPAAPLRLSLMCTHDTTLVPYLLAFGVPLGALLPFASALVFELFEEVQGDGDGEGAAGAAGGGAPVVRVLYNGAAVAFPSLAPTPFVPYAAFREHLLGIGAGD